MAALFDQITNEQQDFLSDYIRLAVKQFALTTGDVDIDDDGKRVLTDVHARFLTNGVEAGDTIEFLPTTPQSMLPAGSFTISSVDDENTIRFGGEAIPLGLHTKYRILNTSPIQGLINDQFNSLASTVNVDKAEALKLEAINAPWYDATTAAVFQYFAERTGLDGFRFTFPVLQADLDNVTLVPGPIIADPGPLLYPFQYSRIPPDRRPGTPPGLGTPALLGGPDLSPPAIPPDPPISGPLLPIPIDAGELPAVLEEDNFYTQNSFPYSATESARLISIRDAQDDALTREIAAIDLLIPILDLELADLRERGVTSTGLHAVLSVARNRLTIARARAVYAQTDITDGLPAVTTGSGPTAARLAFIQTVRPSEISSRVAEITKDQSLWVQMRYVMLHRRVNPLNGSLTLLRLADARILDIQDTIVTLKEERKTVNYPLGVISG
jgi:hypothetical protein